MRRRDWLPAALGLAASPALRAAPPLRVIYPRPPREVDPRHWYPLQLLEMALQASGVSFELQPSADIMVQSRSLLEVAAGNEAVHIAWSMTSREREQRLLPVRIPLYRGLYGWRLLLVQRDSLERWSQVRSLDDLRKLELIQGHDWPDTEILRANGIKVNPASTADARINMLRAGRGAGYPRSVLEIWEEQGRQRDWARIEPRLALHYPTAMYYFVRPGDTRLAGLVERGLNRLLADGRFEQHFEQVYRGDLRQAGLRHRRVIQLSNPLLPPQTPLDRKELWYRPA
ncbi:hypothetical protein [Pelomonas sp. SE-A7]|uniref:substrate-binding periplasmic protein n=1 Tax=Pelomonas sp. SE-A7 TaxID=3054953 RepID=UPI00259C9CF9|nr:hypothetical protein [Pelomonas sp. SE-A7]MDM4766409.1 hypothetical protein [Pelomonas sp. SE-A7]